MARVGGSDRTYIRVTSENCHKCNFLTMSTHASPEQSYTRCDSRQLTAFTISSDKRHETVYIQEMRTLEQLDGLATCRHATLIQNCFKMYSKRIILATDGSWVQYLPGVAGQTLDLCDSKSIDSYQSYKLISFHY